MNQPISKHKGFVLPMVVFLIVVLAGAVVAISRLTVDNSTSQTQALQKARAQQFAQSGLDWAVHRMVTNVTNPEEADCTLTPTAHPNFTALVLTVSCSKSVYEGGDVVLWNVEAVAQSAGLTPEQSEYVWHRMIAVVEEQD